MCTHSITFWKPDYIKEIIFPVTVAIITYVLFKKIDEWKNRRTNCILGVLIIESLLEEVYTGLSLMNEVLNNSTSLASIAQLPNKSWSGMSTIPNEVLLRIIKISKNKKPVSFLPRQIRSHCKNYFIHMNSNWLSCIGSGTSWRKNTQSLINGGYLEATEKVIAMLEQTKNLLEKNSKRIFPK